MSVEWPEWLPRPVCEGCGKDSLKSLCDTCCEAVVLSEKAAQAGMVLNYWKWMFGGPEGLADYEATKRKLMEC